MLKRTRRSKVRIPSPQVPSTLNHFISSLGQTLYTRGSPESLAIMDKQIFRLIGKATTLAA